MNYLVRFIIFLVLVEHVRSLRDILVTADVIVVIVVIVVVVVLVVIGFFWKIIISLFTSLKT